MGIIKDEDKQQLKKAFEVLEEPVKLVMFTRETDCEHCELTREMVEGVASLSDKITVEIHDIEKEADLAGEYRVDKVPAIVVMGEQDYGIRFFGVPAGHEFTTLIEDILDVVPTSPDDPAQAELDASFRVAAWTAPLSQYDDIQTNVFDVGVDHRGGDKALFYVAVRRVGVIVLEFDPASQTPLVEIDRIQTPDFPGKVEVRQDNDTLIVNDYGGGIRVYEE
jgi:hypothetical protein